jgi:hypothetical protein
VNWEQVPLSGRQFARVLLVKNLINLSNRREVTELVKSLQGEFFVATFEEIYPEAVMEFRQMQQLGALPALRMQLGKKFTVKANDPFGVNRVH